MGEILPFPARARARAQDTRATEAALLRKVIEEGRTPSTSDDISKTAQQLDERIGRAATLLGWGGVKRICKEIWPDHDNPAQCRRDLRRTKKAKKLLEHVKRIAGAIGASEDDVLLEAFRDTSYEREVARLRGKGTGPKASAEPELEAFWSVLSETLHALAGMVIRHEALGEHVERLVALHGCYSLALDTIHPSSNRLLRMPLANSDEHVDEFPPVPSVVLFTEPKSKVVERVMTFRDTGEVVPVRMSVLREVRLAIGPADDVLVPAPLFEFRSVLQLVGANGPLWIRCPWLYLDENEVEVNVGGAWRVADILFDGGDPDAMPEGYDGELGKRLWQFPATLEAPLQLEHNYVVWRPVTAGTCRDVLLRPLDAVVLAIPSQEGRDDCPETFLPPGSLAEAIEAALHLDGPESLAGRLRAEAARMAALVRGWHSEREGAMEAMHRALRTRWEGWS